MEIKYPLEIVTLQKCFDEILTIFENFQFTWLANKLYIQPYIS